MGKNGGQDINWAQNATLAGCGHNGIDIHLFEVMDPGEYVYCGRIELVSKPYTDTQPGEDGNPRTMWMFPVRPVPDNDVKKPQMFVFKDIKMAASKDGKIYLNEKDFKELMEAAKEEHTGKSDKKEQITVGANLDLQV